MDFQEKIPGQTSTIKEAFEVQHKVPVNCKIFRTLSSEILIHTVSTPNF